MIDNNKETSALLDSDDPSVPSSKLKSALRQKTTTYPQPKQNPTQPLNLMGKAQYEKTDKENYVYTRSAQLILRIYSAFQRSFIGRNLVKIITFIPDLWSELFKKPTTRNVTFNTATSVAGTINEKNAENSQVSKEIKLISRYQIGEFRNSRHTAYADVLKNPTIETVNMLRKLLEEQYESLHTALNDIGSPGDQSVIHSYTATVLVEISQQFSQHNNLITLNKTERIGMLQQLRYFFGYKTQLTLFSQLERKAAVQQMSQNIDLSWLLASFLYQTPQKTFDNMWLHKASIKTSPKKKLVSQTKLSKSLSQFFSEEYTPASSSLKRYLAYMKQYYSRNFNEKLQSGSTPTAFLSDSIDIKGFDWKEKQETLDNELNLINHDIWRLAQERNIYKSLEKICIELKSNNSKTLEQTLSTLLDPKSVFWQSDFLLFFEKLHETIISLPDLDQQWTKKTILTSINAVMSKFDNASSFWIKNLQELAVFSNMHAETKALLFKNLADCLSNFKDIQEARSQCPLLLDFQNNSEDFQKALFQKAIDNIFHQRKENNTIILEVLFDKKYIKGIQHVQQLFDKYHQESTPQKLAKKLIVDLKHHETTSLFDNNENKWEKNAFQTLITQIETNFLNDNTEAAHQHFQQIIYAWESSHSHFLHNPPQHNTMASLLFRSVSTALKKQTQLGYEKETINHTLETYMPQNSNSTGRLPERESCSPLRSP